MRKLFAVLALLTVATVASAQSPVVPVLFERVTPVSNFRGAADNAPMLVIKYFPPQGATTAFTGTTTIATVQNTSMTFVVNGAAYAGFEAPVAGALGGVIDLTDGSANTLGEVVDIINSTAVTFSTGYFRAAIVNGLRDDGVTAMLADGADTDVTSPSGEVIFWDSSVLDDEDLLFSNAVAGSSTAFGDLAKYFFNSKNIEPNPFLGVRSVVNYMFERFTNAGTLSDVTIYAVKENYQSGKGCVATATCGPNSGSSEIVRVLFVQAAGATTAATTLPAGLELLAADEKVFVRVTASGADTSVWSLNLAGYQYRDSR